MAIDWNVKNAVNRDVERQHLNKILADIRASVDALNKTTGKPASDIESAVGKMVENNTESGINVTYNAAKKVLDFVITDFTITLTGDVTGSGTVSSLGDVSISTSVDDSIGIEEAPTDGLTYWRVAGDWQYVGVALESLANMSGTGFTVIRSNDSWITREFEVVAGELVVTNADGNDGNPIFGLADVVDSNTGTLQGVTVDGKGRVTGTTDATITAGAGIDVVNGDAAAGPPTISHGYTSSVANLNSDNSNGVVLQDIALTFDTFGHVQTISVGTVDLDTRYAPATILASTITDGDTTHAPDGNAVFDALAGKEPTIAAGTTAQYRRGDKTWQDFATDVRGAALTGLSTATATAITATDSVLVGFGKAQAQINANVATLAGKANLATNNIWAGNQTITNSGSPSLNIVSTSTGSALCNLDSQAGTLATFTLKTNGSNRIVFTKGSVAETGGNVGSDCEIRAYTDAGAFNFRFLTLKRDSGDIIPGRDNLQNLGGASNRLKEIFCGNATINTSDAREKTPLRPLNAAELAVARDLAGLIGIFQWLEAIERKGEEGARLHVGLIAQQVIAAFAAHGLDAMRYGAVCYDEWPERVEPAEYEAALGEDGEPTGEMVCVKPEVIHPAGNRYGIRYGELSMFMIAGQEARLRALEANATNDRARANHTGTQTMATL